MSNATNLAVTWQVHGVTGGNSMFGTTSNGVYTAPATVNILRPTAIGTFTVTITATEGSISHSQPATLTVQ